MSLYLEVYVEERNYVSLMIQFLQINSNGLYFNIRKI